MPDSLWTVADMVANSLDLADIEVSDLLDDVPYLRQMPSTMSSQGTIHKYVKETTAPTVDFRDVNVGRDLSKSADTLVSEDLKLIDFSWACDKGLADAWIQGPSWFVAREGFRHIKAAMFKSESQVFNGTTDGDAAGFEGFADKLNALSNPMVSNGGSSAAGAVNSVYLIRQGIADVVHVVKGDGFELGTTIVQDMLDATPQHFPAYYTPGATWQCLQVGSIHTVHRIANLDAANPLTDDKISAGISTFPSGRGPSVIVMNRTRLAELQQSRTATNPTGAPAPFPTSAFNVPIITVDSLVNTETVVA